MSKYKFRHRVLRHGGHVFIARDLDYLSYVSPADLPSSVPEECFMVLIGPDVVPRVCGGHREHYSAEDAQHVAAWLNERENGYPSLNYLAQRWAIQDGRVAPVVRK